MLHGVTNQQAKRDTTLGDITGEYLREIDGEYLLGIHFWHDFRQVKNERTNLDQAPYGNVKV